MPEWKLIWIEELLVSNSVRHKIEIKHGIDVDWLRDKLVQKNNLLSLLVSHGQHGQRLTISIIEPTKGTIRCYLAIVDENYSEYKLITAFITRNRGVRRR